MKAFPSRESIYGSDVIGVKENSGMDLRDYFASKAMQSLLTVPARDLSHGSVNDIYILGEYIARWSYEIADEMMKAREKK
jgi:hypothetical protein